ncbi:MAG: YdeI/OmpD-associated family protein [Bacteroidota bacterium]
MTPEIAHYFSSGCGRCKLYETPACKVHHWKNELLEMRQIALESGLEEQIKWGQLCYTLKGKNIVIVASFKEYVGMLFFKGSLLADTENLLVSASDNPNVSRQIRVKSCAEILNIRTKIAAYLQEAIALEEKGVKVQKKGISEYPVPEELLQKFESDEAFKNAFYALTLGRQKGYLLYFSQAKQVATRIARIEKSLDAIFSGKGMHD